MIRILAGICARIIVCCKDNGTTAAAAASYEMVFDAVRTLCKFSLLISQQNYFDLAHNAADYALLQYYQKKGIFWKRKMLQSEMVKIAD